MLAVFSRAGWPVERRYESGVVDLDFSLDETEEFLDSVERREQRADSRAVARLLLPRTIAVVGASDTPGSVGQALWRHVTGGATGSVFPVNPRHDTIGGRTAYPTLGDVPVPVSLAVVAVPARALPAIVDDCIASHVRGAVIITSVEGTDIDVEALVERARSYGVRLIGPGSMGIASSRPSIGLQASLVPVTLPPGNVAISLQSGSLGASLLRHADELRMGLSWFVSLGDKGDVSGNDLLQFWEDDDTTRVIAMYTESFGNPRKFARIARRVSQKRPIVAVRTGAALLGPSGGALYQHAGLIEVPTVAAMLDTARVLAMQPVLRGPRIAVLANARSPETLSRAALTVAGLIPVDPPVGLDWRSTPAEYGTAVRAALEADDVDGLLVVHAPPLARAVAAPVADIDTAAAGSTKPVVAVLMGGRNGPLRVGSPLPAFSFPEPAAAALGRSYQYGTWLQHEAVAAAGAEVADIDRAKVAAVIAAALERGATELDTAEVAVVLSAYGIDVPATTSCLADDAVVAADAIGYPVAVKAQHRHLGRSARAGVALDLGSADDVTHALAVMEDAHRRRRRQRRRPADGSAGARPAHPHDIRRPPRPARDDRPRQLDGRPRRRRGLAVGTAVVGGRLGAARHVARRAGVGQRRPLVGGRGGHADARRPARGRPPGDHVRRPQPDHRFRRAHGSDRRDDRDRRVPIRSRPAAATGMTAWS